MSNSPTDVEHHRGLERLYLQAPCNVPLGLSIRVDAQAAEVSLPVSEALFHAAGAVHGSHYFKLLDDAAFFAANSLVPDVFVLTASFSLHFFRPVTSGTLLARGRVTKPGRSLIFAESLLLGSDGKELARGSGTFARSALSLEGVPGYRSAEPEPI